MKIFLSFFVLVLFFINLQAQTNDSVNVQVKDSVQVSDTLAAPADSLKSDSVTVQKRVHVIPIYRQSLTGRSEYLGEINCNKIIRDVYRYTGDLFRNFPLAFERSLGVTGQPNEVLIYGAGFNQVSYLRNGTLINNRLTNSFDLNNIQSEIIDSIEIIPSTRSFLYGSFNNNAAVNFITRYHFVPDSTRSPYSRVRFYQASTEEAMIDFIYNSNFSRRLNVTLGVTNVTSDLRFIQTPNGNINAYGAWMGTARFRYYLSNQFNIVGSYKYNKSNSRLYGGIDADSTLARLRSTDINNIYSEDDQITKFFERYQKLTRHEYNIELIGNTFENLKSEYKFYYSFDQIEFRQNDTAIGRTPYIFNNNKYNLYGGFIRQSFENNFLGIDATAGYEAVDYKADVISEKDKVNSFFVSGRMYLNLPDKTIVPSVFVKYLDYNKKSYTGIGTDISINLIPRTQLYAGVSYYKRPLSIIEKNDRDKSVFSTDPYLKETIAFEFGSKFKNNFLSTNLSLFYRQTNNDLLPVVLTDKLSGFTIRDIRTYGAGLEADYNFWKISIETNSAYYLLEYGEKKYFYLPDFTSSSGIYYKDILFNYNLELKTGFRARFTGWQYPIAYDFERNITGPTSPGFFGWDDLGDLYPNTEASYTVDFQFIGRIRKSAIIYLSVENLFGKNYYIVPFYPMYQRGLIVGISWEFLN